MSNIIPSVADERRAYPTYTLEDDCTCIHSEIQQKDEQSVDSLVLITMKPEEKVVAFIQEMFSVPLAWSKGILAWSEGIFISVTTETGSVHF